MGNRFYIPNNRAQTALGFAELAARLYTNKTRVGLREDELAAKNTRFEREFGKNEVPGIDDAPGTKEVLGVRQRNTNTVANASLARTGQMREEARDKLPIAQQKQAAHRKYMEGEVVYNNWDNLGKTVPGAEHLANYVKDLQKKTPGLTRQQAFNSIKPREEIFLRGMNKEISKRIDKAKLDGDVAELEYLVTHQNEVNKPNWLERSFNFPPEETTTLAANSRLVGNETGETIAEGIRTSTTRGELTENQVSKSFQEFALMTEPPMGMEPEQYHSYLFSAYKGLTRQGFTTSDAYEEVLKNATAIGGAPEPTKTTNTSNNNLKSIVDKAF